jgi:nitrate reductase NapAB chaperone NapD
MIKEAKMIDIVETEMISVMGAEITTIHMEIKMTDTMEININDKETEMTMVIEMMSMEMLIKTIITDTDTQKVIIT